MGDGTRLVKTIQTITSRRATSGDFVMGTVLSINPLTVRVGNVTLPKDFLMVSPFCVETKINLNHTHDLTGSTKNTDLGSHTHTVTIGGTTYGASYTELGSHNHEVELESANGLGIITLWRGLQVGDTVLMLKSSNAQKYYILQRQEGIKN